MRKDHFSISYFSPADLEVRNGRGHENEGLVISSCSLQQALREAVNGDKKESQRQDQGKAKENAGQGGHPQKDHDGQKKADEEGAGSARITQESQPDREGRGQIDAGQPAGAAQSSHTDAEPARATSAGSISPIGQRPRVDQC
jgi:hypothetical protein